MKKIYRVVYCGEWEAEGFFDEEGNLLHAWHSNDANYRSEYMDPLFKAIGYEVVYVNKPTKAQIKAIDEFTGG